MIFEFDKVPCYYLKLRWAEQLARRFYNVRMEGLGITGRQFTLLSFRLIVSAIFLDWSFIHSMPYISSPLEFLLLISVAHAMLLTTAVFGLLGIFYRFCNFTNSLLGNLASTSYTMYFCHTLFIFWLALYMMHMDIPAFTKWLIGCLITWPLTYICGKLLLQTPLFAASKKAKVS